MQTDFTWPSGQEMPVQIPHKSSSYSKCQDDSTPSRCCTACTGCRLITESHTRWKWSHSKFSAPQHQPISAVTYSPATVCGIYGRRTLLCCVNLSPKLTSPDVVSVTQLLPSGTHILELQLQYSKAREWQSSNPGLRLIFLIWLIPNSNDVTCATTASEVTTYGRIEICLLLLLLLLFFIIIIDIFITTTNLLLLSASLPNWHIVLQCADTQYLLIISK